MQGLVQLLDAPMSSIWAVFAKEDGTPEFVPVIALGLFQTWMDTPQGREERRTACAMVAAERIMVADGFPNFVGYVDAPQETPKLRENVQKKLAELEQKRLAAAGQKIIVPGRDKPGILAPIDPDKLN